jgi:Fe-S oxidoreductase
VRYCGSFPKLFDAIDGYCTDPQYAEVDAKKLKTEDINEVVDLCFQCKLCYIKCPYTPGDHEWAIDFPRLMARAKAKKVKDDGVSLADRALGNPDLVGKLGTATSPLANWANESKLHRQFMQSFLGFTRTRSGRPLQPRHWPPNLQRTASRAALKPRRRWRFFPPAT